MYRYQLLSFIRANLLQFRISYFYSLDTTKLDTWNTLIESDVQTMEWLGSGSEDDDDDDDDDDEEDGMETE